MCAQGVRPPDMRRNVSEYQTLFPTIDFSQANTFFHFSIINKYFYKKKYSFINSIYKALSQYIKETHT